jgi:hypothetical protein
VRVRVSVIGVPFLDDQSVARFVQFPSGEALDPVARRLAQWRRRSVMTCSYPPVVGS